MSGGPFCMRCGAPCTVTYEPAGFDHFWGWQVYRQHERCPNARGWFTRHTDRVDRWPERAQFFGFTDSTILLPEARVVDPEPAEQPAEKGDSE
jgi:hypothetical protein